MKRIVFAAGLLALLVLVMFRVEAADRSPDAKVSAHAGNISSLIDPAKLKALGERAAKPRIQKCVYWLATARSDGCKPEHVLDLALTGIPSKTPTISGLHAGPLNGWLRSWPNRGA